MTTSTVRVVGMTCDHCVRAVRSEVSEIVGVTDVDVDLPSGTVTIASEQPLDRDVVAAAVEEAGYEVAG